MAVSQEIREYGKWSSRELEKTFGEQTVIPVLTINDRSLVIPRARVLVNAGFKRLEIADRTEHTLYAIEAISEQFQSEGVKVGIGTVEEPSRFEAAKKAGAVFAVSPGLYLDMIGTAVDSGIAWMVGVATPTELRMAKIHGWYVLKQFEAREGFVDAVKSTSPDTKFCVTGGVTRTNAALWLSKPNVKYVGGGWAAGEGNDAKNEQGENFIEAQDWAGLEEYLRGIANSHLPRVA